MKFNPATQTLDRVRKHRDLTTNHEGGGAYTVDAETELYLTTCASFLEDKYYTSASQDLAALRALIVKVGPKFALQLAAYARQQMHLRSMPIVLLAEASRLYVNEPNEPKPLLEEYAPKVLLRADEPAELVGYYINVLLDGKQPTKFTIPAALKRGIAKAFERWDEYQLAKYNNTRREVKMRDVVRLVHPKPKDDEWADLFKKIINDELKTPDTWEVKISTEGSTAKNWDAIAPKMGIFALVRNLRNFEQKGAKKAIAHAISVITDEEKVRKSRMLPFRWLAAANNVQSVELQDALRIAIELSVGNVPVWDGSTAIFGDNSGSMNASVSAKSTMRRRDIAGLMSAIMLHRSAGAVVCGAFGDVLGVVRMSRKDSLLTNAQKMIDARVGHSTNAFLSLKYLIENRIPVDRVVIFSDMQCYSTDTSQGRWYSDPHLAIHWNEYRTKINRSARLYSVDLAGYGTAQFPQNDDSVALMAGWSDRIFELIPALEAGQTAVDVIKNEW